METQPQQPQIRQPLRKPLRKPLQGVLNIVRFNWHFYLLASVFILLLVILALFVPFSEQKYSFLMLIMAFLVFLPMFISLLVSAYVYDFSDLYSFSWIKNLQIPAQSKIININAGFDETSILLKNNHHFENLQVFDFYDETKHTEISIKRARKAYPAFANTQNITTNHIPLENNSVDAVFLIFSAHEIREKTERNIFFSELNRIISANGKVILVEHLQDIPNFMAYTVGFLHFHKKITWQNTFQASNFSIKQEIKHTPFVSVFVLEKKS